MIFWTLVRWWEQEGLVFQGRSEEGEVVGIGGGEVEEVGVGDEMKAEADGIM